MEKQVERFDLSSLKRVMSAEVIPSAFSFSLLCQEILSGGINPVPKALKRLDFLFHDFQARYGQMKDPLEAISSLNTYLFTDLKFKCHTEDSSFVDDYFLDRILEKRRSSPLSLAMLYKELARRLNISSVDYVNFPGLSLVKVLYNHQLLFINPAENGKLLSVSDLQTYLYKVYGKTVVLSGSFLETPSEIHVLNRYLVKLKNLYFDLRQWDFLLGVLDLLVCLNPVKTHELKERGLLLYQLGYTSEACADLAAFVTQARPSPETERLRQLVTVLENPKITPLY